MKEEFLHYIWKYSLFNKTQLKTTEGKKVSVFSVGEQLHTAGPDFFNAKLEIQGQVWVGNVEIHVKASDWYLHHHETDTAYDSVILHVVWDCDVAVFRGDNSEVSTIELKGLVPKVLLDNYTQMMRSKKWIPCQDSINLVDSFLMKFWLERLYFERLEQKTRLINNVLIDSNSDWEAVFFLLMAKNFGLKSNGEAMFELAESIGFSVFRKECGNQKSLEALFFGQANLLNQELEDSYYEDLQKSYQFLKHKYGLSALIGNPLAFFGMRPMNFPTIRISQFCNLYHSKGKLFAELMEVTELNRFYEILGAKTSEFWETHYTFGNVAVKKKKRLTKSFIDLLIINTIIPIKISYLKQLGTFNSEDIIAIITQIKPEKNSVISKFKECKMQVDNALVSQAYIQLEKHYCSPKKCLDCTIGNELLKM